MRDPHHFGFRNVESTCQRSVPGHLAVFCKEKEGWGGAIIYNYQLSTNSKLNPQPSTLFHKRNKLKLPAVKKPFITKLYIRDYKQGHKGERHIGGAE